MIHCFAPSVNLQSPSAVYFNVVANIYPHTFSCTVLSSLKLDVPARNSFFFLNIFNNNKLNGILNSKKEPFAKIFAIIKINYNVKGVQKITVGTHFTLCTIDHSWLFHA